jgi:hypothetical protein
MEVLHCAGLDVHKDTVVACVRHMVNATVKREVKTFDTTTKGLAICAVAASMLTTIYHMLGNNLLQRSRSRLL